MGPHKPRALMTAEERDSVNARVRAYRELHREERRERNRARARAYYRKHRDQLRAYSREWQRRKRAEQPEIERQKRRAKYIRTYSPEKAAARNRRAKYGLGPDQYIRLFNEQGGVCAVCQHETPWRSLDVDHDHMSGRVRGLLCSNCNRAIGLCNDDPERLRAAAAYLEQARLARRDVDAEAA